MSEQVENLTAASTSDDGRISSEVATAERPDAVAGGAMKGDAGSELLPCSHVLTSEQRELLDRLRRSLKEEFGARDVDLYLDEEDMVRRYLNGHGWNFDTARSYLAKSLQWRERVPRPAAWACSYCVDNPGYHCMRQVGFDLAGRPVFYSSFIQPSVTRNTGDDSVEHFVYLTENAVRSIRQRELAGQSPVSPRVETWVWIMDCTGMGWAACNPKIAIQVNSLLGDHYPERLGLTIALNAGFLMRSAWAAIKVFLAPATANKLLYLSDLAEQQNLFDRELFDWLQDEEELNKLQPLPESQRLFWRKPEDASAHDPRGTRSYVRDFVEPASLAAAGDDADGDVHVPSRCRRPLPHPNTVAEGRRASSPL